MLLKHLRYDEDRKVQAEMMVKLLKNCTNPVVFLGHLNSEPGCRDYSIITEVVKVWYKVKYTHCPMIECLNVGYWTTWLWEISGVYFLSKPFKVSLKNILAKLYQLCTCRLAYARISHGGLSDSEMQIGKFLTQKEDSNSEWVYNVHPEDVPDWMSFPEK